MAKGTGASVLESPGVSSDLAGNETTNSVQPAGETGQDTGAAGGTPPATPTLPEGFRRLTDLRKRAPKQTYDVLGDWVGKTIRLDGVNFKTKQDGDKTIIESGEMTFSEYDPADPDKETDQTATSQIPRGAIRALFEGIRANPDVTIVCQIVKTKRGIALQ